MCDTVSLGGPHQKLRQKSNNFLDEKKIDFTERKLNKHFAKMDEIFVKMSSKILSKVYQNSYNLNENYLISFFIFLRISFN